MSEKPKEQVEEWLKKLERESWQLELLVSAFTIFLLIGANTAYEDFLISLNYEYNTANSLLGIVYFFLILIKYSIEALTISLIVHLMLRGFWIGTIGLRSVQPKVDFEKLNYNEFFTEKLKQNGVISLDKMVVRLDELCSVIFAFSFLIISILIAFGMYLICLVLVSFIASSIIELTSGVLAQILTVIIIAFSVVYLLMGIIYMLDYFTLGFFKKVKWITKIYYPFYRFFNVLTLSRLSKSIYYYLISKFSKFRIRLVFTVLAAIVICSVIFEFDQNRYFPYADTPLMFTSNSYDDLRDSEEYVEKVSIPSQYIDKPFFPLFIRYHPTDNSLINSHCPDFEPIRDEGFSSKIQMKATDNGLQISSREDYGEEDFEQLLTCHSGIYQISINDSIYTNLKYRFFSHPNHDQKGLLTVIPTGAFMQGENVLTIQKVKMDSARVRTLVDYAELPFWYQETVP